MPIRLTAVLTHPVQYYSPWFRFIAEAVPDIELTVLYATIPTADRAGVGFGRPIDWGTPLLDGYGWRLLRPPRDRDSVASSSLFGADVRGVGRAIDECQPDVVLVPGWHSFVYVRALAACRQRRVPVMYRGDTHLGNRPRSISRRLLWRAKNRFLLKQFDAYLVVGTRSREFLAAHGVNPRRMYASPHAIDGGQFGAAAANDAADRAAARRTLGIAADAFVVLFAGKLKPSKRPLDVVRAAARAGEVDVVVAGDGALHNECVAEAARLRVRLAMLGFCDQPAMARAYAIADCLVLPSEAGPEGETWGLVVNEALSAGLPCIVSDQVGCAPDLLTNAFAGRVFKAGDVDALARAIFDVQVLVARDRARVRAACRAAIATSTYGDATAGLLSAARDLTGRSSASAAAPSGAVLGSGR